MGAPVKGNIPTWCLDITNNKNEMNLIIRNCDKAFENPITERNVYSKLLEKFIKKVFLYLHINAMSALDSVYYMQIILKQGMRTLV